MRHFPDALPQVTFLPCLTWVRLAIEPMEEATRAAAWMALNEAQHAILDAEAARLELLRLPDRLRLVAAAITATLRLLPQGSDVGALLRARRLACANANALLDGGGTIAANVLMDGILRSRDRLGGPPPVMPTLDPSRPGERVYPHETA